MNNTTHWIEAKVIFESDEPAMAADLIANIFYDAGLQGVCLEEPDMPMDASADPSLSMGGNYYAVSGYFPVDDRMESRQSMLDSRLADLLKEHGIVSHVVRRRIDEQDWSETWKAYFFPEKITGRIVVKPTWRDYAPESGEVVIDIDPGMAFGTGTHPSTSLSVAMIERFLRPGDTFLDVGVGSGILMVAAAKLGAREVWGVDNDETAVEIAGANLRLNRIHASTFKVMRGDLVQGISRRFSLIAANILPEVIIRLLDHIRNLMAPDGLFICSGIIDKKADIVLEKIAQVGLETIEKRSADEWVAITAKKTRKGDSAVHAD